MTDLEAMDTITHIRLRPAMYIEKTNKKGILHLLFGMIDYLVQEHREGNGNKIELTVFEDGEFFISSNHSKFSFEEIKQFFTTVNENGRRRVVKSKFPVSLPDTLDFVTTNALSQELYA